MRLVLTHAHRWLRPLHGRWEAGKVILFDDSFIHEVYHFGTEPRYVLYCSVWHPDIARAHQLLTNNGS